MGELDFQQLVLKRKKWVEINRENNFDLNGILAGLYNDPSHFVYEILQNAEDAGANTVRFKLHVDRLEIFHDGVDFNDEDIDGITGIGISTKKDDINAIGKFGVGFKSVFAITQTPIIHSGPYHIEIKDFVVPSKISSSEEVEHTKITLPFNHELRSEEEVFVLVGQLARN